MQKIHGTTGKPGTPGDIPACNTGHFQARLMPTFAQQGPQGLQHQCMEF